MASQPTNMRQTNPGCRPKLADALDLLKKDIFLNFNCHAVGTVESFDSTRQVANIKIAYKKTYGNFDQTTGSYNYKLVDYPILLDCPVVCLGGGGAALTFPISAGDECLVLFNDRDIDNWFAGQSGGTVASSRTHSFSDGIALVGIRSINNWIANYDGNRALLKGGSAAVGVNKSNNKVLITNNSPTNTATLNSALQQLITGIKALTFGGSGIDAGSESGINAAASQLSSLLE